MQHDQKQLHQLALDYPWLMFPVGTLNIVKVHDADDLLCLVLNFLVVVSFKLGDDHVAASQEFFQCDVLLHFRFGLIARQGAPHPSPLRLHSNKAGGASHTA